MTLILIVLALLLTVPGGLPARAADEVKLMAGDETPAFEMEGTDGKTHVLKDHAGKRPIVIAWFPKAFTSG